MLITYKKNIVMQHSNVHVSLETIAMQHTGSISGVYIIVWGGKEEK